MSKYGTKYQGKYIKSGNTYTVDVEKLTEYSTVEAAKPTIGNIGSASIVDNGTDFDITGAVGFGFSPSNNLVVDERVKVECTISGLSDTSNQIACKMVSNFLGGTVRTDIDVQFLDRDGDYVFYLTTTITDTTSWLRFDVTGAPDFNISDVIISEELVETTTTISKLMPNPVTFGTRGSGRNEEDKDEIIIGSELEFNFYSTVEDVNQFDDTFRGNYKDWRLSYYRDSTLIWRGWLQTENLVREFVTDQYEIKLVAVDGLANLKNVPFTHFVSGVEFTDRVSFITSIKRAMDNNGIDLDYKVQMNIIENDEMTSSENALQEADHESARFTKDNNGRSEQLNCFETLENLLRLWGVEMFQAEGNWWIVSKVETSSPLFTYTFDVLTESREATNVLTLNASSYQFKNRGTQEMMSPIKAHEVTFLNTNIGTSQILNGDFSNGTTNWTNNGFSSFTAPDGVAILVTTTPTDFIQGDNFTLTPTGNDTIKITFKIKLDSVSADDQLRAPAFEMRLFKTSTEIISEDFGQTFLIKDADYLTYSNTFPVSLNGSDYNIRLYIFDGIFALTTATVNLKEITSESTFEDGTNATLDKIFKTTNTPSTAINTSENQILIGDSIQNNDVGLIKIGANKSASWKRHGKTETLSIMQIIGLNKIVDRKEYKKYINVTAMDTTDAIRPYNRIQILEPDITYLVELVENSGGFASVSLNVLGTGLHVGDSIVLSTDDAIYITESGTITGFDAAGAVITDITYTFDAGEGTLKREINSIYRINSYKKTHYNWETKLELEEMLTTDPTERHTIIALNSSDGS